MAERPAETWPGQQVARLGGGPFEVFGLAAVFFLVEPAALQLPRNLP